MGYDDKLAAGIQCDTDHRPLAGIEKKGLLMNRADIDFSAVVKNADRTVVTALPLLAAKTAFSVDNLKNLNSGKSEFVRGDADNSHKNMFVGRFPTVTAAELKTINALSDDAEVVLIIETKFKGPDQKSAYKIFGLDVGMKLVSGAYDPQSEKGAYIFELASLDGYEEPKPFYFWLEGASDGSYAETKTRFDALLA